MRVIKYGVFIFLIFINIHVYAQDSTVIDGNIPTSLNHRHLKINVLYDYQYDYNRPIFADTCEIIDGKFSFKLPNKSFEQYVITLIDINLADSTKTRVSANHRSANFYLRPNYTVINFTDTLLKQYEVLGNTDDSKIKILNNLANGSKFAPQDITKNILSFVKTNQNNFSVIKAVKMLIKKIPDEDVIKLYNDLPDSIKTNSTAQDIEYYINNLTIGKQAPNFEQQNFDGKLLRLTDFRGSFVLIEFWASWCIPCRKETPYLRQAYGKYKKKKFTIISVSLDHKKDLWINAIENDKLTWPHVSDLKGWQNEVSSNIYKISSVPSNFLIDPEGKIIAKNLTGLELMSQLGRMKL